MTVIEKVKKANSIKEILSFDTDLWLKYKDCTKLKIFLEIRDYYISNFDNTDMWRVGVSSGGGWEHVRGVITTKIQLKILKDLYAAYLENTQFNFFTGDMITCILCYPLLYDEIKTDLSWENIDLIFGIFKEWIDTH